MLETRFLFKMMSQFQDEKLCKVDADGRLMSSKSINWQ